MQNKENQSFVGLTIVVNYSHNLNAALYAKVFLDHGRDYSLCLQLFGKRKLSEKTTCKMLVKLTPGVNFIIIAEATFASVGLR